MKVISNSVYEAIKLDNTFSPYGELQKKEQELKFYPPHDALCALEIIAEFIPSAIGISANVKKCHSMITYRSNLMIYRSQLWQSTAIRRTFSSGIQPARNIKRPFGETKSE